MAIVGAARKTLSLVANLATKCRDDGLRQTCWYYSNRAHETLRDYRLGIATTGFIDRQSLGHRGEHFDYEAMNYRSLDVLFNHLRPDPSLDVFLDVGCGKGRALVAAGACSFKRVIGIEVNAALAEIARRNVALARNRLRCRDVQVLTVDAAAFEPPDDVTVVLLFNPFDASVLAKVQTALLESLRANPRRLRIAYVHPARERDPFVSCRWLRKSCNLPTPGWNEVRMVLHEAVTTPCL